MSGREYSGREENDMPAVVVFLIFVICLILAIPVSISLGIASVLPGAVDPSFTASGTYVIRSML